MWKNIKLDLVKTNKISYMQLIFVHKIIHMNWSKLNEFVGQNDRYELCDDRGNWGSHQKHVFFRENLSLKMKNQCVSYVVVLTLWTENRAFQNWMFQRYKRRTQPRAGESPNTYVRRVCGVSTIYATSSSVKGQPPIQKSFDQKYFWEVKTVFSAGKTCFLL